MSALNDASITLIKARQEVDVTLGPEHRAWAAELDAAIEAVVKARLDLHRARDLLAVIHRDGGHYTAEHGIEKSCADAVLVITADRVARDDKYGKEPL